MKAAFLRKNLFLNAKKRKYFWKQVIGLFFSFFLSLNALADDITITAGYLNCKQKDNNILPVCVASPFSEDLVSKYQLHESEVNELLYQLSDSNLKKLGRAFNIFLMCGYYVDGMANFGHGYGAFNCQVYDSKKSYIGSIKSGFLYVILEKVSVP